MAGIQGTNKYEFSENENLTLSVLSENLHKLGILILAAGLLFVAYLVVSFIDPTAILSLSDTKSTMLGVVDYGLWIVIAILVIYLSITVIRLSGPIGQIVKTSGADISHLMHFVHDLTNMLRISFVALVAICVLLAISLMLLVLVF
jgi:hypothetical protein